MDKDNENIALEGQIKLTDGDEKKILEDDKEESKQLSPALKSSNTEKKVYGLEKTKATLKASLKPVNKRGRALVNSDEQEYFCKLRADGRNQTDSARIAYPNDSNPRQRGYELMQMPHIKERIEELKTERAYAAKLVDPQESLIRWNEIYNNAMEQGEIKVAIEAQKQIDKINGAEAYVVKQQLEVKGLFRGEEEEEWAKSAKRLSSLIQTDLVPKDPNKVN